MNLIICLDDKNGYSFASRRQSKDRVQLERMLELVGERKLYLNSYSSKLFESLPDNVVVSDTPQFSAGQDDYCFVENINIISTNIDSLIIYRWNRHYPSDKQLPQELLSGKKLVSSTDFVGHSHEKITEEVYQ